MKTLGNRSAEVFAACDRIAANAVASGQKSVKPTVRLVRQYGVEGGNQTDVQNDIHAWFLSVFREHVEAESVPGVPEPVVQAFQSFWREANTAASAAFDIEREASEARERMARAECEAAFAMKDETARQLEAAESSLIQFKQQVTELSAALTAANDRVQALTVENVANELRHTQHLANVSDQHNAQIQALDQKLQEAIHVRTEAIGKLDNANGERARLSAELATTKETLDGRVTELKILRDKLTAETTLSHKLAGDKVEWQRKFEAEREKVEELEGARDDLLVVRTQLADLQSRHQSTESSRDQAITDAALLRRDLESEKARSQEVINDNVKLSRELATTTAAVEAKAAEVLALEAKVTDLESRK